VRGKEAKALVDRASHASQLTFAQRQWRELRAKAGGLLAQALVEVGQLVTRVQSTVRRVGAERARKTLLAEIDFIVVDVNKALLKGDARAVQSLALPQYLRLERAGL